MSITDIFKNHKTALSFEFFPPKTDKGFENLFSTVDNLKYLDPAYISVTYGAGGSGREKTHDLLVRIKKELNIPVVSHLTCVGHTKDEVGEILDRYALEGVDNILALRGDPPAGDTSFVQPKDGFGYAAELVSYIKERHPHMGIGVAGFPEGHPDTPNRLLEMDYLKAKVDAGADYICTQLFFNNADFYDFRERCEISGITVPIIAGIMPITSVATMKRMSELSLGARIPAKLLKAIYRAPNDEYVENVGIHWAAEQVNDLVDNDIKGIHFYTLNKAKQIKLICDSIGITNSAQLK